MCQAYTKTCPRTKHPNQPILQCHQLIKAINRLPVLSGRQASAASRKTTAIAHINVCKNITHLDVNFVKDKMNTLLEYDGSIVHDAHVEESRYHGTSLVWEECDRCDVLLHSKLCAAILDNYDVDWASKDPDTLYEEFKDVIDKSLKPRASKREDTIVVRPVTPSPSPINQLPTPPKTPSSPTPLPKRKAEHLSTDEAHSTPVAQQHRPTKRPKLTTTTLIPQMQPAIRPTAPKPRPPPHPTNTVSLSHLRAPLPLRSPTPTPPPTPSPLPSFQAHYEKSFETSRNRSTLFLQEMRQRASDLETMEADFRNGIRRLLGKVARFEAELAVHAARQGVVIEAMPAD